MGKWKNLQGCYHWWENSFNPKPQKAIWPRSTRWPFLCAHQMSGMLLNNRSWRQLLDMLQHLVLIKCIHPAYEDFELFPTPWHRRVCKEKASYRRVVLRDWPNIHPFIYSIFSDVQFPNKTEIWIIISCKSRMLTIRAISKNQTKPTIDFHLLFSLHRSKAHLCYRWLY